MKGGAQCQLFYGNEAQQPTVIYRLLGDVRFEKLVLVSLIIEAAHRMRFVA